MADSSGSTVRSRTASAPPTVRQQADSANDDSELNTTRRPGSSGAPSAGAATNASKRGRASDEAEARDHHHDEGSDSDQTDAAVQGRPTRRKSAHDDADGPPLAQPQPQLQTAEAAHARTARAAGAANCHARRQSPPPASPRASDSAAASRVEAGDAPSPVLALTAGSKRTSSRALGTPGPPDGDRGSDTGSIRSTPSVVNAHVPKRGRVYAAALAQGLAGITLGDSAGASAGIGQVPEDGADARGSGFGHVSPQLIMQGPGSGRHNASRTFETGAVGPARLDGGLASPPSGNEPRRRLPLPASLSVPGYHPHYRPQDVVAEDEDEADDDRADGGTGGAGHDPHGNGKDARAGPRYDDEDDDEYDDLDGHVPQRMRLMASHGHGNYSGLDYGAAGQGAAGHSGQVLAGGPPRARLSSVSSSLAMSVAAGPGAGGVSLPRMAEIAAVSSLDPGVLPFVYTVREGGSLDPATAEATVQALTAHHLSKALSEASAMLDRLGIQVSFGRAPTAVPLHLYAPVQPGPSSGAAAHAHAGYAMDAGAQAQSRGHYLSAAAGRAGGMGTRAVDRPAAAGDRRGAAGHKRLAPHDDTAEDGGDGGRPQQPSARGNRAVRAHAGPTDAGSAAGATGHHASSVGAVDDESHQAPAGQEGHAPDHTAVMNASAGPGSSSAGGMASQPQGSRPTPPASVTGATDAGTSAGGPAVAQGTGCVLLLTGFVPAQVSCDDLFNLCSVYGEVKRVKRLFKKPDTAVVEFGSPAQASAAMAALQGCPIRGRRLRIDRSTMAEVNVAPPVATAGNTVPLGPDGKAWAVDYSQSGLQRGTGSASSAGRHDGVLPRHAVPPSAVLHLANLPSDGAGVTQEQLEAEVRLLVGSHGKVEALRFLPQGASTAPQQAFMRLASLEEGIGALMALHNSSFKGKRLAVSFTTSEV